jgi:Bax protein
VFLADRGVWVPLHSVPDDPVSLPSSPAVALVPALAALGPSSADRQGLPAAEPAGRRAVRASAAAGPAVAASARRPSAGAAPPHPSPYLADRPAPLAGALGRSASPHLDAYSARVAAAAEAGAAVPVPRLADSLESRVVAVTLLGAGLSARVLAGEDLPAMSQLPSAQRYLVQLHVASAEELYALLPAMGDANGWVTIGPATLPPDLDELSVDAMKETFLEALAPTVAFQNATVEAQRSRLLEIMAAQGRAGSEDRAFVARMAAYYGLAGGPALPTLADSLRSLLLRADMVPTSIALAQAAIESGWGTSLLSRQRNNMYGQQGWADGFREMFGMAAAQRRSGMADYPTVATCVGSYIHNLNTHDAYADFRFRRKQMRERAQPLDPVDLAFGLGEYSTRGWAYIHDVLGIMEYNGLQRFDAASVAPVAPPSG